jgi:putative flavoprotein involved in K+ transport
MEWWEIGGILHRHVSDIPDVKDGKPGALERARSMEFPLVSGIGEGGQGKSISLKELEESGVTLLGKLVGIRGSKAEFEDSAGWIEKAVAGTRLEFEMLVGFARAHHSEMGKPLPGLGAFVPSELVADWTPLKGPRLLDLQEAGINSIIAATGYRSRFEWLSIQGILDDRGYPKGWDGISPCEGLYFLGLFNLQRLSSTCLCNEGLDAEAILPQLLAHIARS